MMDTVNLANPGGNAHQQVTSDLMMAGLPSLADTLNLAAPIEDVATRAPENIVFTSIRLTVRVYFAPVGTSPGAIRAMWTALTLCGLSDDDRPQAWQTWIFSMAALAFPELVRMLRADTAAVDYLLEPFPESFTTSATDAIRYHSLDHDEPTYVDFPSDFPASSALPHTRELASASELEGLYAYFSMTVFILGKSVGPDNVTALTENRPNAIIRKRGLGGCAHILTGAGKIDPKNYGKIKAGWARSARPRIQTIRILAALVATEQRSEVYDSMVINMTMLKNANQTYLYHIHDVLRACPWALNIPAVASAYAHYARMVREVHAEPAWYRPYYKLAMQDSSKHVKRRGLEALIAIATAFAYQTNPSMNKYRISEGCIHIVNEFISMGRARGMRFREPADQQHTETAIAAF